MKILIAEDDLIAAHQLKGDLEEAGHTVTAIARNPMDALRALKKTPPDLAILDITLESGNDEGLEIADLLPALHAIPFIYLTGHTESEMMLRAGNTRPYAYLIKPYRKEELLMQVQLAHDRFMEQSPAATEAADSFYLKNNGIHERIAYDDLLYVKSQRHSVSIYTTKHKNPYVIGTNIGEIAHYFRHPTLLSLSQSLIVNKKHIRSIHKKTLSINHITEDLELSETNRKILMNTLTILKTKSPKKSN